MRDDGSQDGTVRILEKYREKGLLSYYVGQNVGLKKAFGIYYEGKGTLYWPNGEKFYEGEFKNGKQDGLGTEYNEEGQKVYDGTYADGKRNGFRISYWPETGKKI